jgi:hypothetical protein
MERVPPFRPPEVSPHRFIDREARRFQSTFKPLAFQWGVFIQLGSNRRHRQKKGAPKPTP